MSRGRTVAPGKLVCRSPGPSTSVCDHLHGRGFAGVIKVKAGHWGGL